MSWLRMSNILLPSHWPAYTYSLQRLKSSQAENFLSFPLKSPGIVLFFGQIKMFKFCTSSILPVFANLAECWGPSNKHEGGAWSEQHQKRDPVSDKNDY